MLNINNRVFLDISVNGVSIPLERLVFSSLTMHSARQFRFPCAQLIIADSINYFTDKPIVDGDLISIFTGKTLDRSEGKVRTFRVFDVKTRNLRGSQEYTFDLIFSNVKFVNENSKSAYSGGVSDVVKEIADYCGMSYEVSPSADNQVWYPLGAKRSEFIKDITKYAFSSTKSAFVSGVTLEGVLKFLNIETIDFSNPDTLMVFNKKESGNSVRVADRKELSSSGLQNNVAAYKTQMLMQSTDSTNVVSEVEVPIKSNTLNVNEEINNGLTGSKFLFGTIDNGNTHSNYQQAYYQNMRILSTFGKSLMLITDEETDTDLFGVINYIDFVSHSNKVEMNRLLSGGYLVDGKTILIKPTQYYEKLRVTRQGFNADVITKNSLSLIGVA